MEEQKAKYENATMLSLQDKIKEQEKSLATLVQNITSIKKEQEANKQRLEIELERTKKEYEKELETQEKEYESELEEVVSKMNSTFFEALKNETMLLEQSKCGDDENDTGSAEEDTNQCNETLAGSKDREYRGCQTTTRKGYTCQAWSDLKPHNHTNTPQLRKNAGLESNNYCRNPDGEPTIWCYTTDKDKRWDFCDPIGSSTVEEASTTDVCPSGWTCDTSEDEKYVSAAGYNVYGSTYKTINDVTKDQCLKKCNDDKCKSAVFIPTTQRCELKETTVT